MGPLIDTNAQNNMMQAIDAAVNQGGKLLFGGTPLKMAGLEKGSFVTPAVIEVKNDYPVVQKETFAPVLFLPQTGMRLTRR